MDTRSDDDRLDLALLDAVAGLFAQLIAEGEALARELGIPAFVMKALHMIDAPLAMKELGSRMRCDPSFITGIADMLERHGLAARENDPADRRVKRLVLTPAGLDLKLRMERQMAARAPWRSVLTADERTALLGLMRKMSPPAPARGCRAEEVGTLTPATAPPPAARPRGGTRERGTGRAQEAARAPAR